MRTIRDGFLLLVVLTAVTGGIYPLVVTGIAQMIFPDAASGSWLHQGDRIIGSRLIGQPFHDAGHFWSRPSATSERPYNAARSGGSNLGPLHPDLVAAVASRIEILRAASGADPAEPVPVDLVTASGSGLDPHLSPAAAFYQVNRVATARGVAPEEVRSLVRRHVEPRQFGILGEPRVNVLLLNLDLDRRFGPPPSLESREEAPDR